MSEPFVFDPRSPEYKTPYGAVPCGREIAFHCRPLASERFTHCAIVLKLEFYQAERKMELAFSGYEGDRACFSLAIPAPPEPELIWYHFYFWRDDGSGCILDKQGYRWQVQPDPWQLTVYRENHTPAWFGRGLVYQIFPDRFCRLSIPDTEGMIGNRWVHENWYDTPEWRPDENGIVQNRDFFGGSLAGIASKLHDLAEMGVSVLYLCPIFESASNHRYDTADYGKIDPMLGTEEDFRSLCRSARELGIRVVLDGVFNHTGSRSLYFNQDGWYPVLGAAQSQESPYYGWFSFHPWPHSYDSWWGIDTLPAVREDHPDYIDYIIENENSIVRRWLRAGASGWRLDVADELPDSFIEKLRAAVEETDPDALLLGEVWEDASVKIAYSRRRKYLLGRELHGVMNYPFRSALLTYLLGGGAEDFRESMETLRENYPRSAFYSAMNFLGTHDTPRILTLLGASRTPEHKDDRAAYRLSPEERTKGLALVRLAVLILFSFPGAPMIYYGDEIAMEGFEDPLNRSGYDWDHGDRELRNWFSRLGCLRRDLAPLNRGELRWIHAAGPLLAFAREFEGKTVLTVTNASAEGLDLNLPWSGSCRDLLSGRSFFPAAERLSLELPPYCGLLLESES